MSACPAGSRHYNCPGNKGGFSGCCSQDACDPNFTRICFEENYGAPIIQAKRDCDDTLGGKGFQWWTCQTLGFRGCCTRDACQGALEYCYTQIYREEHMERTDPVGPQPPSEDEEDIGTKGGKDNNGGSLKPSVPIPNDEPTPIIPSDNLGGSSTTSSSPASNNPEVKGGLKKGAMIGIGVGVGAVVLFILIALIFHLRKKKGSPVDSEGGEVTDINPPSSTEKMDTQNIAVVKDDHNEHFGGGPKDRPMSFIPQSPGPPPYNSTPPSPYTVSPPQHPQIYEAPGSVPIKPQIAPVGSPTPTTPQSPSFNYPQANNRPLSELGPRY